MNSKSLLIAIAAFALTATGVQAYGGAVLSRAGLSEEQAEAFAEARELRTAGKYTEARDTLVEAGITEAELRALHLAANEVRDAIQKAVENNDYTAFRKAAADSPLGDIITSPADFEQFCEAHNLRQQGEWEGAAEIMDELGLPESGRSSGHRRHLTTNFTEDQQEALRVARQSNDRATIQAIFDEAGYDHEISMRGRGSR